MPRIWILAAALMMPAPFALGGDMARAPVAGGELQYEVSGDGEPVLLIHGAHVADAFVPLMDQAVLEEYQLIRYRRRGYADSAPAQSSPDEYISSAAADAADILDHLDIERAHVVGHSSGGVIALQFALDRPERLASLTLLEPALLMVPSGEKLGENLQPAIDLYESGKPVAAVDAFMKVVAGAQWQEFISQQVPGGVEQASADAATFFELEAPAIMGWTFDESRAGHFDRPVLYLWGGESGAVMGVEGHYVEGRDLVKSWFSQTEEHYIKGVNHALQMQNPQAVAEGIAEFLESSSMH